MSPKKVTGDGERHRVSRNLYGKKGPASRSSEASRKRGRRPEASDVSLAAVEVVTGTSGRGESVTQAVMQAPGRAENVTGTTDCADIACKPSREGSATRRKRHTNHPEEPGRADRLGQP